MKTFQCSLTLRMASRGQVVVNIQLSQYLHKQMKGDIWPSEIQNGFGNAKDVHKLSNHTHYCFSRRPRNGKDVGYLVLWNMTVDKYIVLDWECGGGQLIIKCSNGSLKAVIEYSETFGFMQMCPHFDMTQHWDREVEVERSGLYLFINWLKKICIM